MISLCPYLWCHTKSRSDHLKNGPKSVHLDTVIYTWNQSELLAYVTTLVSRNFLFDRGDRIPTLCLGLKGCLDLIKQPHAVEGGKGLFDVTEKLLRSTVKPDASTEFRVVGERDFEGTTFAVVLGELLLYLVYDGYVGNRGPLREGPFLALLILESLVV